jgi:ribose transport system substrate-binding protein
MLGGKGKMAELEGIPGSSAGRDRGKGFNDELKEKCSGVTVAAELAKGAPRRRRPGSSPWR